MMMNEELARKAIDQIEGMSIPVSIYASEGGKCSDGWDDVIDDDLSREELIYLVHKQIGHDELFEDVAETVVDLQQKWTEMAQQGAWDYEEPTPSVENPVPYELDDLSEMLDELDEEDMDEDTLEEIRSQLNDIEDGEYTFFFSVEVNGFTLCEEVEETIELTAKEVLGLMYGAYNIPQLFDGFGVEALDEEFINEKAKDKDFAADNDYYEYGGHSDALENYLKSWATLISKIYVGEVDENDLDSWMAYFSDVVNLNDTIEHWYEEQMGA